MTTRSPIVRDAVGIGVATGAYGLSFGALAVAAGLSLPQACSLSLLMFTGASQFAFVGLIGGGAAGAVASALLLGARNGLYGLRLAPLLRRRRALAAQLVIDESTAMAVVRRTPEDARLGFWATGAAVFACWNLGTLAGALAGSALSDPRALGLDAAAPAAFVALLAPRLDAREPRTAAALAAAAAVIAVPVVPAGVPVLIAGAVAALLGTRRRPASLASSPPATEGRA
jgi:predicted branched-subunit amino acid permease